MANVITLNNLNYTYDGQISTEIFYKPSVATPDFLRVFRVMEGIPFKRQLQLANNLSKIVKTDPGCSPTSSGTVDLPNRTLEVCDLFFRVEQCFDVFEDKWLTEELPFGVTRPELGRFIETMVQTLIVDALRRDNFRIFSFSDTDAVSADYSQCDGLFKRLIDGEATYEVKKVNDITTLNTTLATSAVGYLQNLYNQAPIILKQLLPSQKRFLVTGNFYENLWNTWDGNQLTLGSLGLTLNGETFRFRGIEVVPIYAWDADLQDVANPFASIFNTVAIYTEVQNHVVGLGRAADLRGVKQWYENKDRKVYWEGAYKMGYNYVHGDLTAISYGIVS
jgi:hypothetical protein